MSRLAIARILISTLVLVSTFTPPLSAQTNVGQVVSDAAKEQFEKQTGLDQVTDVTEIKADKLADRAVKYVTSETPSLTMAHLIQQLRGENGEGLPSSFKLYLTKTVNRNAPYRTRNACERAANQRLREGLGNAKAKAYFTPRVDIAREAIKGIAGGGKSLGELIADQGKAEVEKLISETLRGAAADKVETVTIPHYDECDSTTKITRDPVNKRVIVVTSGNCHCKRFTNKLENETATLADYTVTLVAPVTTQVRIETKPGFLGLRTRHQAQATYKVGRLNVATVANCDCTQPDDPPPPPPLPPRDGRLTQLVDRVSGWFDGPSEPEDTTGDEPTDDQAATPPSDSPDDQQPDDEQDESDPTTDPGSSDDDSDSPPDDQEETETETDSDTLTPPEDESPPQPWSCGTAISIDGRTDVATFPYRTQADGEVNFSCDGSCAPHELCKVVPESVGAGRESCVYCAQLCPEGSFVDQAACESSAGPDQGCIAAGDCYSLQDNEPEDGSGPTDCQQAVRLLMDKYLGRFDPPLTFSADGAVFSDGPHRCLTQSELDQYHITPIIQGIQTAEIQALCPTLEHVSTSENGAGNCTTETVFSF